jgi:hypothetical protein
MKYTAFSHIKMNGLFVKNQILKRDKNNDSPPYLPAILLFRVFIFIFLGEKWFVSLALTFPRSRRLWGAIVVKFERDAKTPFSVEYSHGYFEEIK